MPDFMPDLQSPTDGLLLVGHGTRDASGVEEMQTLAHRVAALLPGVRVESCFLELAQPDIQQGIERMHAGGVRQLTVMPLLLFAAGHAKRDIPRQLEEAQRRRPDLDVRLCPHFGCHAKILELSAIRYRQAIERFPPVEPADTVLVMVGRGSREPSALAEMREFARRRGELTPVSEVVTCFLAMAEPSLEQTLGDLSAHAARRIVVQPHLLFHGELLDRIRAEVAARAASQPDKQWIIAPHLGPDRRVAETVIELSARPAPFPLAAEHAE